MGVLFWVVCADGGRAAAVGLNPTRQPPAVQWCVPAQTVRVRLLIVLPVAAALWVSIWLSMGAGEGWPWRLRAGGGACLWLVSCTAWIGWWRSQRGGTLHWTGTQWMWRQRGAGASHYLGEAPQVVWDAQRSMLLRLHAPLAPSGAVQQWVWVAAHQPQMQGLCAVRWGDLRRAVYSSALSAQR